MRMHGPVQFCHFLSVDGQLYNVIKITLQQQLHSDSKEQTVMVETGSPTLSTEDGIRRRRRHCRRGSDGAELPCR